ncbi:MAG: protein phosphatase 2C domain-containing protein [Desulforhopalus sp.]|nr:protein phosphatase 2C domain-containing protein [Desulforhopalus sp.]
MNHSSRVAAYSKTDPGLKRPDNQDVCAADLDRGFFMVADGMGGVAGGEVASALFLAAVTETFAGPREPSVDKGRERVHAAFLLANAKIQAHAAATPTHKGLGCTGELLILCQDHIVLGHVGDSRTYCFRRGILDRLTIDHSLVQDQVDRGILTWEQAERSNLRNVLTRAVGIDAKLIVDIVCRQVQPGDIYLLATDGLHGMVDEWEILPILGYDAPLSFKADILINMANDAGGGDNTSVTLVEILP